MKILIRNLSRTTTEETLRPLFENFGKLQSLVIVKDAETNLSKGFGFAEMPTPGEAKAAIKNLNGKNLDGSIVRIKKAEAKS